MKKLLLFLLAAAGLTLVAYILVQRSPGRPQPLRGTPDHWPEVPRKPATPSPAADEQREAVMAPPVAKGAGTRKAAAPRKAAATRKDAARKKTPPDRAAGPASDAPAAPSEVTEPKPTASEPHSA